VNETSWSVSLDGLRIFTTYNITVVGFTRAGEGWTTDIIQVTTDQAGKYYF